MKEILLVAYNQYGYHTDMFKYAEYLSNKYKVIYICKDQLLDRVESGNENIEVIYSDNNKSKNDFIKLCRYIINDRKPCCIIVDYFFKCCLLAINYKKRSILDIRTATISNNKFKKYIRDLFIRIESVLFKKVIILSEGLREELKINKNKSKIIPLGADKQISYDDMIMNKDNIEIIYVGTFDNRNIIETVKGFHMFIQKNPNIANKIKYNIVGYSNNNEDNIIRNYIRDNKLNNVIMHGRIRNDKLHDMWKNNLIGISYIPLNDYFNNQPPTKTFEYISNGLICIATKTKYNKNIINSKNGICINDNSNEVCDALNEIINNISNYDRVKISKDAQKYSWKFIVLDKLLPYIEE